MRTYGTSEIARRIGVHPNTVRLYEKLELIPRPERKANGYRVFSDFHLAQFRLARTALRVEVLQNGLRKQAVRIVKASAAGRFELAEALAADYLRHIQTERSNAEEAIEIAKNSLRWKAAEPDDRFWTRKQAALALGTTIDTLRNWEMNGLLTVKRSRNGYRVYTGGDLRRLTMIRALRCANYSLSAILRMLNALVGDPGADIRAVIDTPYESDDVISVCDRLLTSLLAAEENAKDIQRSLREMRIRFGPNPTL